MKVKIMQWTTFEADRKRNRHEASGMATAEFECSNAATIARDLDRRGDHSEHAQLFTLQPGEKLATGHGVTVVYENGRRRTFHA